MKRVGVGVTADVDADVTVLGNVSAYSVTGTAFGVEAVGVGDAYVTVEGSVYARSVSGTGAAGIVAASDGNVGVTVEGPIKVLGNEAYGVVAESLGGGNVTVNLGDVTVYQYGATHQGRAAGVVSYTR